MGVDIRVVGLFTLAQARGPSSSSGRRSWTRFRLPFWGRRRGWIAVAQVALALSGLGLSGVGSRPETPWVALALTLAVALSAATQDIAIDAYAVDVLRKEEHGVAVGLRTAVYRAAMTLSGGLAIWAAASLGWGAVNLLLGIVYLPLILVTWRSPEPEEPPAGPKTLCATRSGCRSSNASRATARSRSWSSSSSTSWPTRSRSLCSGPSSSTWGTAGSTAGSSSAPRALP
ncbi:MAG: MFS transporter [Holophagales bacterium]|nr:MFS transporter [Holophagales bacterium]